MLFKQIQYRIWLFFWSRKTDFKHHSGIKVKRSYTSTPVSIDLYWMMTDRRTGHHESYYDRIGWHNVINRVKQADHNQRRQFLKDREESRS